MYGIYGRLWYRTYSTNSENTFEKGTTAVFQQLILHIWGLFVEENELENWGHIDQIIFVCFPLVRMHIYFEDSISSCAGEARKHGCHLKCVSHSLNISFA